VTFDDAVLESFSTPSPKRRDKELEDLEYFILDLYQFYGVPVAITEVDIVQVVVDFRPLGGSCPEVVPVQGEEGGECVPLQ
jgi:separase